MASHPLDSLLYQRQCLRNDLTSAEQQTEALRNRLRFWKAKMDEARERWNSSDDHEQNHAQESSKSKRKKKDLQRQADTRAAKSSEDQRRKRAKQRHGVNSLRRHVETSEDRTMEIATHLHGVHARLENHKNACMEQGRVQRYPYYHDASVQEWPYQNNTFSIAGNGGFFQQPTLPAGVNGYWDTSMGPSLPNAHQSSMSVFPANYWNTGDPMSTNNLTVPDSEYYRLLSTFSNMPMPSSESPQHMYSHQVSFPWPSGKHYSSFMQHRRYADTSRISSFQTISISPIDEQSTLLTPTAFDSQQCPKRRRLNGAAQVYLPQRALVVDGARSERKDLDADVKRRFAERQRTGKHMSLRRSYSSSALGSIG